MNSLPIFLDKHAHAVTPRIRATSMPKKTKQMASSLAFMALDRFFRFRRAGGRYEYSKINARKKINKIAAKRRRGLVHGKKSIYADAWAENEEKRFRKLGGEYAPALADSDTPAWIHPTDPISKSEEIRMLQLMKDCNDEEKEQLRSEIEAVAGNEPDNEDGDVTSTSEEDQSSEESQSSEEDAESSEEEEEEDQDQDLDEDEIERNNLITSKINRLNKKSGMNIQKTPTVKNIENVHVELGDLTWDNHKLQIMCGTSQLVVSIGTKSKPKRLRITAQIIKGIFIVDEGRHFDEIVFEEEEVTIGNVLSSSSSSSSSTNTTSTSSTSSSSSTSLPSSNNIGKRKRDDNNGDGNNKNSKKSKKITKKKKKKKKKKILPRNRTVTITIDLFVPPQFEDGKVEQKTSATGKKSNYTYWSKSQDTPSISNRVVIIIDESGRTQRNNAQSNAIKNLKIFTKVNLKGDGDWSIGYEMAAPPVDAPKTNQAEWEARLKASTTVFKGMGLAKMHIEKDNIALDEMKRILTKIDIEYYQWATGKAPLLLDTAEQEKEDGENRCLCVTCGCQICLPCFSATGNYPDGAICPLWCKVLRDNDNNITFETHMECESIEISPHLKKVKQRELEKLEDLSSTEEEESSEDEDEESENEDSEE